MSEIQWKTFVKEIFEVERNSVKAPISKSNGDEIRTFYEETVNFCESSSVSTNFKEEKKKVNSSVKKTEIDDNFFLNSLIREAEANNVHNLKKLLKSHPNFNIDTTDQFGWSVLMCAAGSGSLSVVKFLLKIGANTELKDRNGNCCLLIARRKKYFNVVEAILSKNDFKNEKSVPVKCDQIQKFYCDKCKIDVTSGDQHFTSTIHLFNTRPASNKTCYAIPESNKGFQILLKSGWDKDKGLGPDGSGSKFPLKTVLKRDRKGIGSHGANKARVTHMLVHEAREVSATKKTVKREIKRKQISDRRKEIFLRRALS